MCADLMLDLFFVSSAGCAGMMQFWPCLRTTSRAALPACQRRFQEEPWRQTLGDTSQEGYLHKYERGTREKFR